MLGKQFCPRCKGREMAEKIMAKVKLELSSEEKR